MEDARESFEKNSMRADFNDWKYFLNLFSEYDSSTTENKLFQYHFTSPEMSLLADYIDISAITKGVDNDFKKIVNIMKWVNSNLLGDGMCVPPNQFDAISVLEKTKNEGLKSNCWMYAVVMTELCLCAGFYARMIRCMPLDLDYHDCHCLCTVYLPEYKRWIVFDPANNAYYLNENMMPMDIPMLRKAVIESTPIYIPQAGREKTNHLIQYFAKTLFRFECEAECGVGNEASLKKRTFFALNPQKFKLTDKTICIRGRNIQMLYFYSENIFWQPPF